jgi:hypothetical protein
MIRPDGLRRGHLHVLDIETRREYAFHLKGGTDSDLNGVDRRVARKSKSLYPAFYNDRDSLLKGREKIFKGISKKA